VVLVAGGDAAESLRADLAAADFPVDRVSPHIGAAQDTATASAIVAGAANAALAGVAEREAFPPVRDRAPEHVAVVGDPLVARDLAGMASVTLIADGTDLADRSLPEDVRIVRGTATDLAREDGGYRLTVERRVTEDCTRCGRCLRQHPDATTSVPVQVTGDVAPGGCPVGAIRPADDPAVSEYEVDQVVWPGTGSRLATDRWVHGIRTGVAGAVRRAARLRARPEVTVEAGSCAVGAKGMAGCSACESACPNDAITVSNAGSGSVSVEPDRCVACGTCVSVCPTGAIEPTRGFDVPTMADLVESALTPFAETGGSRLPWSSPPAYGVVLVSEAIAPAVRATLSSRSVPAMVPVVVPTVLSVSDAVAISAVAMGADGVVLASDPDRATDPIRETAREANRTLGDLGLGERVEVADTTDPDRLAETMTAALGEPIEPGASGAPTGDSRHAVGVAATTALATGPGSADGPVPMPGSGSVTVEAEGCTLCSTCEDVCPTDALNQTTGTLEFDPGACVGCGHCESACPEAVLSVESGVVVDEGTVQDDHAIVDKPVAECERCGEPFAAEAGLAAVRDRLDGDLPDALDLTVCPSCRSNRGLEGRAVHSE
jgi:ferredoxin